MESIVFPGNIAAALHILAVSPLGREQYFAFEATRPTGCRNGIDFISGTPYHRSSAKYSCHEG